MIKTYLTAFFLTLSCLSASAQSQTFKIEDISKPEKPLYTVPVTELFKNVEKDIKKMSMTGSLVDLGTHPVIAGYLKAYQNHYPLTFSPDIAWLLICQGFANHINYDPEKFRSRVAGFDGKKTLTVTRDGSGIKDFADFQWENIFPEFTDQIAKYAGKELIGNLTADFTTTTPTSLVTSQIAIMESMREFYNYKLMIMGCGISEVTVEGTVKDWEKIMTRLEYLEDFDLKWWTAELKPVIQKIIDTKKGKLDKQFWMNMVKYHKLGVYGSYDGIDGWLLKFYPYLKSYLPPELAKLPSNDTARVNILFASDTDPGFKTRKLYLQKSQFKEIKSLNDLPKEFVNVPFLVEVTDMTGKVVQSYNMEFWAGFMGLKQDPVTFNVKPEIGWAVNKKSD
ncbi:MAG: DUF4419 domain-containing protein [Bacteroidota bacterium]